MLSKLKDNIMTTIKKAYVEIAELLNANSNRKVSTILPQLLELMTAKSSNGSDIGKTFLKDDNGEVFAVYCYYHKQWELTSECEYGSKKGTSSGLNTMCKEGVSNWTKQQRQSKKSKDELLNLVATGEVEVCDLASAQEAIEEAKQVIVAREDKHGYSSADQVLMFGKKAHVLVDDEL
jgi:hypothetical protein